MIVGTTETHVTWLSAMSGQNLLAENFGAMTSLPPESRVAKTEITYALM